MINMSTKVLFPSTHLSFLVLLEKLEKLLIHRRTIPLKKSLNKPTKDTILFNCNFHFFFVKMTTYKEGTFRSNAVLTINTFFNLPTMLLSLISRHIYHFTIKLYTINSSLRMVSTYKENKPHFLDVK